MPRATAIRALRLCHLLTADSTRRVGEAARARPDAGDRRIAVRVCAAPPSTLTCADLLGELAALATRETAATPRRLAAIIDDAIAVIVHSIAADFLSTRMHVGVRVVAIAA